MPSTVRCGDENHSQKSALLHYTESGEQRVGFGEFLLNHDVQLIADRMDQHLEIISKNFQFIQAYQDSHEIYDTYTSRLS